MTDSKPQVDLINYYCAECNSEDWNLKIGHCDDGRTFLYITCGNPECQQTQRVQHGVTDDTPLIWGEYDITGQGHDPQDMVDEIPKHHLN